MVHDDAATGQQPEQQPIFLYALEQWGLYLKDKYDIPYVAESLVQQAGNGTMLMI